MSVRASQDKRKGMGVDLRGDEGREAEDRGPQCLSEPQTPGRSTSWEAFGKWSPALPLGCHDPRPGLPAAGSTAKSREQAGRLLCPPETGLFWCGRAPATLGTTRCAPGCDGRWSTTALCTTPASSASMKRCTLRTSCSWWRWRAPGPAGFQLQPHRHWQGDLGQVLQPQRACLSLFLHRAPVVCRVDLLTPTVPPHGDGTPVCRPGNKGSRAVKGPAAGHPAVELGFQN